MIDYKKLYFSLFNALTDAIEKLEQNKNIQALCILKLAQTATEEFYISAPQIHIEEP